MIPLPPSLLSLQKRHVSIWSVSTNFPRNCVACNWSALFAEKINSFSTATHSPKKPNCNNVLRFHFRVGLYSACLGTFWTSSRSNSEFLIFLLNPLLTGWSRAALGKNGEENVTLYLNFPTTGCSGPGSLCRDIIV